ncbi:MAG TPA: tetratricopeptide repeat protein [Thermodesulfovibrionales bacterium]|jgi:TolA-binding protein|nr:tetratricopeptide repeat protein [Thermodesulfovibrionales bacterium]
MKKAVLVFMALCLFCVSACTRNKSAELLETAQFEEVQKNREHARELYEEILKKYPESEEAKRARERLSALKEGGGR